MSNNAEIHLHLFDEIGTVMEGVSAAIPHQGHGGSILIKPSLEWAQPRLKVCAYAALQHGNNISVTKTSMHDAGIILLTIWGYARTCLHENVFG